MKPALDILMEELEVEMQDRRDSIKNTFKRMPMGRVWFRRGQNYLGKGWQMRFFFLFLFSSRYGFGFRLWRRGLSFSIKGVHARLFSQRRTNHVLHIEYLKPCR